MYFILIASKRQLRLTFKSTSQYQKNQNEEEIDPKYEWKVRGSPRNGMILKRFSKPTEIDKTIKDLPGALQHATCNHPDKQ